MTYLIAFIVFANGYTLSLPSTVHGSMQTCEAAKGKLLKDIDRTQKNAIVTATCLDR